jgi:hypothetical protein
VEQRVIRLLGLRCTGYEPEKLPCYATRAHGYAGDQPKFIPRGNPTPDWQFTDLMRASRRPSFYRARFVDDGFRSYEWCGHATPCRVGRQCEGPPSQQRRDSNGRMEQQKVRWPTITYQVGLVAGYTSYIGLDIANRTAVVILQNSFNWDLRVGHLLLLRTTPQGEAVTNR